MYELYYYLTVLTVSDPPPKLDLKEEKGEEPPDLNDPNPEDDPPLSEIKLAGMPRLTWTTKAKVRRRGPNLVVGFMSYKTVI